MDKITQIFAAFYLEPPRKTGTAPKAGCTLSVASIDVYRHLKLTPYRAIIPKDASSPSERHAQNWRKVGTIETVSPEAKKQIDQNGFCIYIFTPTLSFDEIEGADPNI